MWFHDRRWILRSAAVSLSAALALSACSSPPPAPDIPEPTRLLVTINIEPFANSDKAGRDLPLVVSLYQVTAPGEFEQADFFELRDEDPTLANEGYELLDEFQMEGSTSRESVYVLHPDARYFGAVAAFRLLDEAQWRAMVEVAPKKENLATVNARQGTLSIENLGAK